MRARRGRRGLDGVHPTATRLVEVTARLIGERGVDGVMLEDVCAAAGVSTGSVYHHFDDFAELLEVGLVRQFAAVTDLVVAGFAAVLDTAGDIDEFYRGFAELNRAALSPDRRGSRLIRARVVAEAAENPRLAAMLEEEKRRLTGRLVDVLVAAQQRGWVDGGLHPTAGAALIQAYVMGRVIDDVGGEQMERDVWLETIDLLVHRMFRPHHP